MKHLAGDSLKGAAQQITLVSFSHLCLVQSLKILADDVPLEVDIVKQYLTH